MYEHSRCSRADAALLHLQNTHHVPRYHGRIYSIEVNVKTQIVIHPYGGDAVDVVKAAEVRNIQGNLKWTGTLQKDKENPLAPLKFPSSRTVREDGTFKDDMHVVAWQEGRNLSSNPGFHVGETKGGGQMVIKSGSMLLFYSKDPYQPPWFKHNGRVLTPTVRRDYPSPFNSDADPLFPDAEGRLESSFSSSSLSIYEPVTSSSSPLPWHSSSDDGTLLRHQPEAQVPPEYHPQHPPSYMQNPPAPSYRSRTYLREIPRIPQTRHAPQSSPTPYHQQHPQSYSHHHQEREQQQPPLQRGYTPSPPAPSSLTDTTPTNPTTVTSRKRPASGPVPLPYPQHQHPRPPQRQFDGPSAPHPQAGNVDATNAWAYSRACRDAGEMSTAAGHHYTDQRQYGGYSDQPLHTAPGLPIGAPAPGIDSGRAEGEKNGVASPVPSVGSMSYRRHPIYNASSSELTKADSFLSVSGPAPASVPGQSVDVPLPGVYCFLIQFLRSFPLSHSILLSQSSPFSPVSSATIACPPCMTSVL